MSGRVSSTSFYVIMQTHKPYMMKEIRADRLIKRTDRPPATAPGEVPILVSVTLPLSLFETPRISVTVDVDDNNLEPINVSADVEEQIAERIRDLVGVSVYVSTDEPDQE